MDAPQGEEREDMEVSRQESVLWWYKSDDPKHPDHDRDEQSSRHFEGCLELVFLLYSDVVISPSYVEFGKYLLATKVCQDVGDEG